MTEDMKQALLADFREWSGGEPPDCEEQILIYVEHAMLANADEIETTWLLREWMVQEWENAEAEQIRHHAFGERLRCPAAETQTAENPKTGGDAPDAPICVMIG